MFGLTGLKDPAGAGHSFNPVLIPVLNKTGGTLTKYGVYALDIEATDGDTTSNAKRLSHLTAVTTATIAAGVLVVAQEAAADDAATNVVVWGYTLLRANGTTAISDSDPLKAQNASAVTIKATAGTDRFHAVSLEDYSTAADGDIAVIWNGEGNR